MGASRNAILIGPIGTPPPRVLCSPFDIPRALQFKKIPSVRFHLCRSESIGKTLDDQYLPPLPYCAARRSHPLLPTL
jgi:hypothetical protein